MSLLGLLLFTAIFIFILVPLVIIRIIGGLFGGRSRRGGYSAPENHSGKREGDVFVSDNTPDQQEKIIDDSIGQYVDYEEVEENN